MSQLFFLCFIVLVLSFTIVNVQAGNSPTILVEPASIHPDGNVVITVTATVPDTRIATQNPIKVQRAIIVNNPAKGLFGRVLEDYYLQFNLTGEPPWGPVILPDVGDTLRIRFPDAMVEVIEAGDANIQVPAGIRGWYTAAEDPRYPLRFPPRDRLTRGTYIVVISGTEDGNYFHEFNFFSVD